MFIVFSAVPFLKAYAQKSESPHVFCVGAGNTIIGVDNGKFQFVEQIRNKQRQLGEPHDSTYKQ